MKPTKPMENGRLADILVSLGCPADKSGEMAVQLERRAISLASERNCSHGEALAHLLSLLRQGWAAREKAVDSALGLS